MRDTCSKCSIARITAFCLSSCCFHLQVREQIDLKVSVGVAVSVCQGQGVLGFEGLTGALALMQFRAGVILVAALESVLSYGGDAEGRAGWALGSLT